MFAFYKERGIAGLPESAKKKVPSLKKVPNSFINSKMMKPTMFFPVN